ncbi:toxin-activating lysine-acyltransferase [Bartonella sp. DGB2]|uniref:toxin-activating lysine-acyltransferase n=1 Tax=Bartonella sp. DGB2 TaxID=3388426 RepID=UPI00398FAD70
MNNTEETNQARIDPLTSLGVMTALMLHSPVHRNWLVWDIERNIGQCIRLGQSKLYTNEEGNFCAFLT